MPLHLLSPVYMTVFCHLVISFNGHTLTPLKELPTGFVLAVIFSVLALLGTWLGTRRGNPQRLAYRPGSGIALCCRYIPR
jgi:LytS/YehU family sensor histidine kinase